MAAFSMPRSFLSMSHEASIFHRISRRRLVLGVVVAICGLAISLLFYRLTLKREQQLTEVQFKLDASLRVEAIRRAVADRVDIVNILAAFYAGSTDVERNEFLEFTEPLLSNHPGIHSLAWAPRVSAGEREAFEKSVHIENLPAFSITEQNSKREYVSAGNRDEYFPILYQVSVEPDCPLCGFDLRSTSLFRRVIDQALTSRSVEALISTSLDGHDANSDQMYVIEPASNAGSVMRDPTKKIDGVVLGAFDVNELVEGALRYFAPAAVDIVVRDSVGHEHNLHVHSRCLSACNKPNMQTQMGATGKPTLHYAANIPVAGHVWSIDCTPLPAYLVEQQTWGPLGTLLIGLAGTILLVGYLTSLTGRTAHVEQLVAEQLAEMRTISNATLDALIIINPDGKIAYWNTAGERIFGYSSDEMLGKRAHDVLVPEHYREAAKRGMEMYRSSGEGSVVGKVVELEALHKNGSTFPIEISVAPLHLRGGWWAVAVIRDVTYRKRTEEALRKEQKLLRDLINLHEHDRQLISYEIHDGLAQQLTGAMFKFQSVAQLQKTDPNAVTSAFEEGIQLLRKGMAEARRLISGLRPPILDELGVVAAVEYLVGEQRQHCNSEIEFVHDVQFDRLAVPLESSVFRIVQECLTNACRYSQSKKILIQLTQADDRLQIHVQDWGVGFDLSTIHGNHFGLRGIQERARLLGGNAVIETVPAEGTLISVELPVVLPSNDLSDENGGNKHW